MKNIATAALAILLCCTLSACASNENKQETGGKVPESGYSVSSEYADGESTPETDKPVVDTDSLFKDIHTKLYSNIAGCASLRSAIVSVWETAIDTKGAVFEDALEALFKGEGYYTPYSGAGTVVPDEYASNFKTALDAVTEDQVLLESLLKELAAEIDNNDKVYTALVNLYSEYIVLYNQVTAPSGSYVSFSSSTNESGSNIQQAEAKLDIVWPYE